jgi:hypothetical protein
VISAAFQWASALGLLFGTGVIEQPREHLLNLGIYSGGSALLLIAGLVIGHLRVERRFGLTSRGGFSLLIWLVLLFTLGLAVSFAFVANAPLDRAYSTRTIGLAMVGWSLLIAWASMFLPRANGAK